MPRARTVKTIKKKKLTGKGFKDVAKKVAKVAIPIAFAVAGAVAAKKLQFQSTAKRYERVGRALHKWHDDIGNETFGVERGIEWPEGDEDSLM